ncbi:hypothetical protein Xoosp13_70 [Xanthomonas phage Xoo-sp13]|nr:hypothetical protein Xoosp13_70 [Xanthomonas phage Xoo-sp13]
MIVVAQKQVYPIILSKCMSDSTWRHEVVGVAYSRDVADNEVTRLNSAIPKNYPESITYSVGVTIPLYTKLLRRKVDLNNE